MEYDGKVFGKRLYAGYIHSRTVRDHGRVHFLSEIIYNTTDYILQYSPNSGTPKADYVRTLCSAVVQACTTTNVIQIVNSTYPSPQYPRSIDIECSTEESALAAAAYLGLDPLLERLVNDGVRDVRTYFGRPLMWAARRGNLEMTRLLLEKGFKIDIVEDLEEAARNGHDDILRLLLDRTPDGYEIAIRAAASGGHLDIISNLMRHDSQASAGKLWNRILFIAARHGQEQVARMAIDEGANPDFMLHPVCPLITPLDAAAKGGHLGVVKLLLTRGATLRPRRQANPLIHAIKSGWLAVAQYLIDHGAIVNPIKTHKELRPLNPWMTAIVHGQADMLRLLIKNGADVNLEPDILKEAYYHVEAHGYAALMSILHDSSGGAS